MSVKMLVGISGADFSLSPGDVTSRFSADEEARMIAGQMAVKAGAPESSAKPKSGEKTVKAKAAETRG